MVLINSCGTSQAKKHWSEEDRAVFRESCVTNSKEELKEKSAPYCDCMLVKVEAEYDDPDKVGELSMSKTMEWAKECLKDFKPETDSLGQAPGDTLIQN